MIVLTAKGTGICLDHDNMMFISRRSFEHDSDIIGSYIDHNGNVQPVIARSAYGEQMIAAILKWEKETSKHATRK